MPDDMAFDAELPINLRFQSELHFTPVAVARLAAALLTPEPGMTVLDVGSGVGKFCITAARARPDAEFVGVEWRPSLVQLARTLAARSSTQNVEFIAADALDLDWSEFAGFYFYNPFAEAMFDGGFKLDGAIATDPLDFIMYISAVRQRLARARQGTRLVTFHGMGAPPPDCYRFRFAETTAAGRLELWVKSRR